MVLVTWRDAWFNFEESDPQEARADYLVQTVGFVVRETPRFLSIAQEVLPDGDGFRAVTHIPVGVIEQVENLKIDKEDRWQSQFTTPSSTERSTSWTRPTS